MTSETNTIPSHPKHLLGISKFLDAGLDLFQRKYRMALPYIILPILGSIVAYVLSGFVATGPGFSPNTSIETLSSALAVLVAVIVSLTSFIASIGTVAIFGEKRITSIKEFVLIGLSYLVTNLLVGLIVLGGFVLLIVPGIIFMLWFSLTNYIVIIERRLGLPAMMRSRQLIKGRVWPFIGRLLFIGLVAIVSMAPFILARASWQSSIVDMIQQIWGYAFIMPLVTAFFITLYKDLDQTRSEDFHYDKKTGRKYLFIGLAGIILGTTFVILLAAWAFKYLFF